MINPKATIGTISSWVLRDHWRNANPRVINCDMTRQTKFSALVADDHQLVRTALVDLLSKQHNIDVVGQAADGIQAVSMAKKFKPDLMTLDIAMPHAQGIAVFTEVKRWSPNTKVAVFSGITTTSLFNELHAAGVEGIFTKRGDLDDFVDALPLLLRGGRYISSDAAQLIETAQNVKNLTSREHQILSLVASGQTTKSIAQALGVSPKTVEHHRANMMTKIGVNSLAGLLAYAVREGLLDGQNQL